MGATPLQIIELVKSLPAEDQRAIREALARPDPLLTKIFRRKLPQQPDGAYFNSEGIPNDDPVFKILEEIESRRHGEPGPPAPVSD